MVTKLDINGTLITFSDVITPADPSFGASIYYQSGVFYQKTQAGVIGTLTNSAGGLGSVTSVSVLTSIPGLASTGSPITVDGTIILSGTLTPGGGGTGIGAYTAGDLLYATAAQTLAKLGIGSAYSLVMSNGTVPIYGTLKAGSGVTLGNSGTGIEITASGSGPWSLTGTLGYLTTSTNKITVGGNTYIGKFGVIGDADEIQARIRANGTQSNAIQTWENSSAGIVAQVNFGGGFVINEQGNDSDTRIESDNNTSMFHVDASADNIGINQSAPNASALVDMVSTAKGLLIPRMTTAQFAAISSKATALLAWDTDKSEITEYDGAAVRSIAARMPQRATMWHDEAIVITGNALTYTISATQNYYGWSEQSAAAVNDEFTHSFYLAAGTYNFYTLGVTFNDQGIATWSIDGASIGTMDWYSVAAVFNVVKSITSITIATSGYHKLNGKAATKNASSSNYKLSLVKYWFRQSSD